MSGETAVAMATGAAERPVYIGRTLERGNFTQLSETLNRQKIPFTERPLLAGYGSFGTSIVVELPRQAQQTADEAAASGTSRAAAGRFILAVPVLSPAFKETGAAGGLSFAHQTALAFIKKMNEEPAAGSDNFDAAVYFLADDWTAGNAADDRTSYAAWLDMLDGDENDITVYMDCASIPDRISVDTAHGKGRTPYIYIKHITQTFNAFGIKLGFSSGSKRISALQEHILHDEFDNTTPVIFLHGTASGSSQQAGSAPSYRPEDFAAALYRYAQNALAVRQEKAAGSDDANYAAFSIARNLFVIREKTIIVLFLNIFTIYIYILYILHKTAKNKKRRTACKIVFAGTAAVFVFALFAGPPGSAGKKAAEQRNFAAVPEAGLLFSEVASQPFLERALFTVTIASSTEPLRFGLSFETTGLDAGLPLPFMYESPVPEQWDNNTVQFALGNYPPNPLTLNLSLPKGMHGVFKIEAYAVDGAYAAASHHFEE